MCIFPGWLISCKHMKNEWKAQTELGLAWKKERIISPVLVRNKLLFFKLFWLEATEWNVYASSCSDKALQSERITDYSCGSKRRHHILQGDLEIRLQCLFPLMYSLFALYFFPRVCCYQVVHCLFEIWCSFQKAFMVNIWECVQWWMGCQAWRGKKLV